MTTAATGSGTITVGEDKSVSGSVTTSGVAGVAAHIHEAAAGKNGPVIVPMTKTGDNTWTVAAGAKFTDAQYESFKAGNTVRERPQRREQRRGNPRSVETVNTESACGRACNRKRRPRGRLVFLFGDEAAPAAEFRNIARLRDRVAAQTNPCTLRPSAR